MKAIITIGVSSSGKTTWAESQKGFYIVSRDEIRRELLDLPETVNLWSKWNFKREKEVTEIYWRLVENHASCKRNIILADTNLNKDRREQMKSRLEAFGYDVEFKQFDVSYEEAIKRDLNRVDSVGSTVLWKQYKELYSEVYKPDESLPKAVIVDVDGTLAAMSGRSPFEWSRVGEDKCNDVVANIVRHFWFSGTQVIIVSGRDGVCHGDTYDWLENSDIPFNRLLTRAQGDMRKDSIIKRELFYNHIRSKYNVVCVIDDRPQVVRMWYLLGLKVICVGDPWNEF